MALTEPTRHAMVPPMTTGTTRRTATSPAAPASGTSPASATASPSTAATGGVGLDLPTFESLYRTESTAMVRVAFLLVGDLGVAEEIVQDAFVRLHTRWNRVDNPGGFLRTCVVNGCRDGLRRRARLGTRLPLLATVEATNPNDAAAGELHDVLLRLPLRQRTAVVGRFYCGWDDDTIAQSLGVRPATVRSLVHRGLAALRRELTP